MKDIKYHIYLNSEEAANAKIKKIKVVSKCPQ